MKTSVHPWPYLAQFCLELGRYASDNSRREKTHTFFNNFFPEYRAVYEEVW
jgi:hypothetical protein